MKALAVLCKVSAVTDDLSKLWPDSDLAIGYEPKCVFVGVCVWRLGCLSVKARLIAEIIQMHTQVHTFTLTHKHIHVNRPYLLLARLLVICKSTNGNPDQIVQIYCRPTSLRRQKNAHKHIYAETHAHGVNGDCWWLRIFNLQIYADIWKHTISLAAQVQLGQAYYHFVLYNVISSSEHLHARTFAHTHTHTHTHTQTHTHTHTHTLDTLTYLLAVPLEAQTVWMLSAVKSITKAAAVIFWQVLFITIIVFINILN